MKQYSERANVFLLTANRVKVKQNTKEYKITIDTLWKKMKILQRKMKKKNGFYYCFRSDEHESPMVKHKKWL